MADPETTLVAQAQAGNRAAFEELVRRTSGLLFARLYLETGDTHRAEDLLQETLLRAYRAIGGLLDARTFRGWLLSIAQAVVIDDARHGQRLKRSGTHAGPLALFGVADESPPPDEQLEREEMRGQVLAMLRSLPEDYRLPLTLRYIGGADYETIRTQLGLTNGSLRGLLHRGLQLMRAKLEQAGKPGGAVCV